MKKVGITEAKNRLSALIDGLKGGSRVLIVDRGRPVARREPVMSGGKNEQNGRLSRLIRDGVVRPGRAALPRSLLTDEPPRKNGGASAVAALIEERREGRLDSGTPQRSCRSSLLRHRAGACSRSLPKILPCSSGGDPRSSAFRHWLG
jgi:antitoxin (DNA-binding transcriptional repressor) of toxin-antitoxin stability system